VQAIRFISELDDEDPKWEELLAVFQQVYFEEFAQFHH
jgi:hypothetical protein